MRIYILIIAVFSFFIARSTIFYNEYFVADQENNHVQHERKLSTEEVKQRGIDLLVNEILEQLEDIDLKKMARSAIFETPYGFRWKMVNLHTGKKIIIKVDKDFKIISARTGKNVKIMYP